MSAWLVFAGVLAVAGLVPALLIGSRGPSESRLVGLQFAGAVTTLLLIALTVVTGQPSYLIVPLALALLAYAGTLVFTRLLAD